MFKNKNPDIVIYNSFFRLQSDIYKQEAILKLWHNNYKSKT